jgi:maltodextrin utilization protein YvdJ
LESSRDIPADSLVSSMQSHKQDEENKEILKAVKTTWHKHKYQNYVILIFLFLCSTISILLAKETSHVLRYALFWDITKR